MSEASLDVRLLIGDADEMRKFRCRQRSRDGNVRQNPVILLQKPHAHRLRCVNRATPANADEAINLFLQEECGSLCDIAAWRVLPDTRENGVIGTAKRLFDLGNNIRLRCQRATSDDEDALDAQARYLVGQVSYAACAEQDVFLWQKEIFSLCGLLTCHAFVPFAR